MPQETKQYNVLIASPGDVAEEREIIRQEVFRWNSMHATETKMILLPIGWETDATPDLRERGQAVINRQLVDDCDILIGVFWTRLGTPTPKAESGTAEEIERAANEGKRCIVYFSDKAVSPSKVNNEQYEKLQAYRKKLNAQGLTDSYSQISEFKEKISRHITKAVQEIAREERESKAAENEASITKKALGLGSQSIRVNDKQDVSFGTLNDANRSIRLLLESRFGIQDIEDLKEREISRIKSALESSELAPLFNQQPSIETVPAIRKIIEDLTVPSIYIVSAISRYGDDSQDDLCEIVRDWIERLSIRNRSGYEWVNYIKTYPALLLLYTLGISTLRSGKANFLLNVIEHEVEIGINGYEANILDAIDPRYVFYRDISKLIDPGFERRYVPVSDHLTILMKTWLYPQEEEKRFINWFDLFELLMSLKSVQQKDDRPYMGSFVWREETYKFWIKMFQDAVYQKGKGGKTILKLFGSLDVFESTAEKFDEIAANYQSNGLARPPFYTSKVIRLAKKGVKVSGWHEVLQIDEENLVVK
ncbi:MAG: DUF4062 domain-containing protein [Cyanobacteria bacterium J06555_3]